jgi:GDP-D-mannose dehydratase
LDKLITFSGKHVLVEIDKNKLRQSDVPDFVGDNTKLRSIGWMPQYTIDKSLIDLLEWRRNEIRTSYT